MMRYQQKCAVLAVLLVLAVSSVAAAAPVLEVDKTEWKMGKVPRNETRNDNFILRNNGDEALVITQIRPSCKSCLGKIEGDTTIGPGESRQLGVTYKAVDSFGEHAMSVTIHSNDPVRPLLRLRLTVEVVPQKDKPASSIEPTAIDVGVTAPERPKTVEITISNLGDAPLNLLSIIPSVGCRPLVDAKDAIPAGGKVVIPVSVTARAKGVIRESIGFETNDPDRPFIEVPIEGYATAEPPPAAGAVVITSAGGDGQGRAGVCMLKVANTSGWTVTILFLDATPEDSPSTVAPGNAIDKSATLSGDAEAPIVLRLELRPAAAGQLSAH